MAGARILVIKQESLRQFVEAEPAFAAIRRSNPGLPIDLLTSPELSKLAKGSPHFDRVLAVGSCEDKDAFKSLTTQLKRIGYEQIFDLDGNRLSLDLKGAMTGFRGPRWIGPKRVVTKPGREAAHFAGAPVKRLITEAKLDFDDRLPDLRWATAARKDSANMKPEWFGITGPFALLVPADDPAKRWTEEAFADIALRLFEQDVTSVVIGNGELTGFVQGIAELAVPDSSTKTSGRVVDLTGKADFAQLAMLARSARLFVAGPGDLLHLCVAVGGSGVAMLRNGDGGEADSLYGRNVIRLTAQDPTGISADSVHTMLANMGLIERAATVS